MAETIDLPMQGPNGPKPKRAFSTRNIVLYGFLIVAALYWLLPLYVMIVTSLKGLPEVRMGNIFSPPMELTFEPWVKAWDSACTGLYCEGLKVGFWNSVQILIPSTLISIAIASVNGYALSFWRFKGSEIFFTILLFGAFIPYQVMLYPLVIILRELHLLIFFIKRGCAYTHHIRHANINATVSQLLCRCTRRAVQSSPCGWGRFLAYIYSNYVANVIANICSGHYFTGHRYLE